MPLCPLMQEPLEGSASCFARWWGATGTWGAPCLSTLSCPNTPPGDVKQTEREMSRRAAGLEGGKERKRPRQMTTEGTHDAGGYAEQQAKEGEQREGVREEERAAGRQRRETSGRPQTGEPTEAAETQEGRLVKKI